LFVLPSFGAVVPIAVGTLSPPLFPIP
jgi:hypothetical protein